MQTKTNSKTKTPISKSNRLKASLFRANKTRIKIKRVCTKDLKLSVIFSSLLCAAALAAPSAYAVASSSSGGHASRNSARHTSRVTTRSASAVPAAGSTTHPGGLYLGGDVGYNLLDTGQAGKADDGKIIYTHSNIQYGLHLGYNFALTPNLQWLMEGGYRYLGKAKQDYSQAQDAGDRYIYTTRAQAADLLFGLKYYVGSSTSLYGKLGAALQFLKLHNTNVDGNGTPATEHRENLNPEWQVGVSQNLGEYVSANLGVDHIGSSTTSSIGTDVLNPSVTSLLLGLDFHALANYQLPNFKVAHPGGLYLGGDVGYNLLDTGQAGKADDGKIIYTHSNIQYGLHLGYNFALTPNLQWLMEGGYRYLGKAKQDASQDQNVYGRYIYTTRAQATDLLFGLKYYVGSSTSLYGKLGAALQFLKLHNTNVDGNSTPATEHRQNLNPEWQVGVSQNLGDYVSANLGIDHIGSSTTATGGAHLLNPSVTSLLLGLDFHALANYQLPNFKVEHPGGLYLGGDVGYNLLDTGQAGKADDGKIIYTHSNIQYGLHLGYNFALTPNLQWLMEGGYRYLGKAKQDRRTKYIYTTYIYTTRAQAADLLFGLKYYVGSSTSLYGKLGAALQFLKLHNTNPTFSDTPTPATEHRENLDPEWQVGISQNLGEYVSANLGVYHIGSSATSYSGCYVLNPSVTSLLLGLDFHAFANYQLPNFKVEHPGGLYLGGDVGYNLLDTGQYGKAVDGTTIYTHSNIQYGLHLGYNFALTQNLQWLMEGGYRYLGKAKQDASNSNPAHIHTTRAQAADLLFGLKYYVGSSTSLYGKLGAALQFLKLHNTNPTFSDTPTPATEQRQNLDPEWQVGISQNLGEYVSANLGVDHIGSSTTSYSLLTNGVSNPSVTSLLVGLSVHF